MRRDCYFCHLKTVEKLLEKFKTDTAKAEEFSQQVNVFMQQNWRLSNPLLATQIQRIAKQHLEINDLYRKEKKQANQLLLSTFDHWEKLINESKDSFHTAAKLAVIGNILDYGAHSVPLKIEQFIHAKLNEALAIDQTEDLRKAIKKASSILYLGDNAGEIVFDKLFIRTFKHPNVTFAVKGQPVLNDATMEDAKMVGIDSYCHVIDNGSDAPSTLLELCSDEFKQVFDSAELIISKGQGNFEGLMEHPKKQLYFLLMAKCNPIANLLHVKKGSMIIKQNNN